MSRWFRFYEGALDDPKVQRLPPELFKAWVNILCLASRNDGTLPCIEDIAFGLRLTEAEAVSLINALANADLLDDVDGKLEPHNWRERQFKSDNCDPTNAARQKRYRDTHKTVTVTDDRNGKDTVTVTPTRAEQIQNRTEEDSSSSLRSDWPSDFREQFWNLYPRKVGKVSALRKLEAVRKKGDVPFARILGAVKAYSATADPQFTAHPTTWLAQGRWDDELPAKHVNGGEPALKVDPYSPEWKAWRAYFESGGKRFAVQRMDVEANANRGFGVPSVWPPSDSPLAAAE